jgi:hypothetical protein
MTLRLAPHTPIVRVHTATLMGRRDHIRTISGLEGCPSRAELSHLPGVRGHHKGLFGAFRHTYVAMRFRVPNTQKMYEFWGPRLGRRATGFYATYVWATFAMFPIGLALFVTLAIATLTHNAVAQGLAVTVIVIGGATIAAMFLTPVLARRAATQTLGVKINRHNNPPRDSSDYEAWCARNGLRPYEANG